MMMLRVVLIGLVSLGGVLGQTSGNKQKASEASPVTSTAKLSREARVSLGEARKMEAESRKVSGPARSRQLELAAVAFERLVVAFDGEPAAAARAAWSAAEIWRRHGSVPLAEKCYLHAARTDAVRYGQRGLLGAADMQRRQQRIEDAMKTYAMAEAKDPRTTRAQEARLWIARMLLAAGKVAKAIERFQAALESAPSKSQGILTANYLAKAWIRQGDLDAAGFVIEHARKLSDGEADGDPVVAQRLLRAYERMSAHKALQRALDKKHEAGKDAVRLDVHRRRTRK